MVPRMSCASLRVFQKARRETNLRDPGAQCGYGKKEVQNFRLLKSRSGTHTCLCQYHHHGRVEQVMGPPDLATKGETGVGGDASRT